jgi:F0F1-type ATP synthase alpha subunit
MTKKRIREGQVMTEVLKQNDLSPLPFEIQVVLFFAALRGRFNDAPLESLAVTQEKFIEYLTSLHAPLLTEIRDSGEITNATEAKLVEALERFSI